MRVRPRLCIGLLVLLGCGSRSGLDDDGIDAPRPVADAAAPVGSLDAGHRPDAGDPPGGDVAEIGRFELPGSFDVRDLVATIEGDACIGGDGGGPTPSEILPEVGVGDGFIACFTPRGRTRVTTFACRADDGVTRLAGNARGDLYALVDRGCVGVGYGVGVLRFGRDLESLARTTITSDEAPGPYVRGLDASDDVVVVGGSMRVPGRVADGDDWHGPFAASLAADDLTTVHVEAARPETSEPIHDVGVRFVALRGGEALLFGTDMEGGRFAPRAGPFVATMSVADGALAPIESRRWHHQYGLFWHPDGRPVVLGTTGGTHVAVQVGDAWTHLRTGYLHSPEAAFRGDELLVVRAIRGELELAGRSFSDTEEGGFLAGLDPGTFEPAWARGLPHGYHEFLVAALPDGTIAVAAVAPFDVEERNHLLLFYR